MDKKSCNWRSGIGYDVIRLNREKERDNRIRELIAIGGRSLDEYPDYIILENGDVYSALNRRVVKLKPGTKQTGYKFVGLIDKYGNRKYEMIHRLVAKAFIPNDDNLPSVNHKDGVKSNNSACNLEWVTHSQNQQHAVQTGLNPPKQRINLSKDDVLRVYAMPGRYCDIAAIFGISAQTVCNIKRKSKKCYAWI